MILGEVNGEIGMLFGVHQMQAQNMMEKEVIRILIVDDHNMFLDGLGLLLLSYPNLSIVNKAVNGEEALQILAIDDKIDIVITDLSMPKLDGFDLCAKISEQYPTIPILALTMHSSSISIKKALKAGAKGYILKNTGHEELIEAIEVLTKGGTYYSDKVKNNLLAGIAGTEEADIYEEVKMTKREKEILQLIVNEYTTQQIADKLFISFHTVESHRKNIMRKLDIHNIAGLIKYALKTGMID